MPRRSSKVGPHERGHTISGRRIRVRPSPKTIRWLERNTSYLVWKYVICGDERERVYSTGEILLTKADIASMHDDRKHRHGYNKKRKKGKTTRRAI